MAESTKVVLLLRPSICMYLACSLFAGGGLDLSGHTWDQFAYLHHWRNELSGVNISRGNGGAGDDFVVWTPSATYVYEAAGGGFSHIFDRDGNDWIAHHLTDRSSFPQSAASDYRGLPNLVFRSDDNGAGHPGFDKCTTIQVDSRTLRTKSLSGKWQWSWSFQESGAELTVEKTDPDHSFWFLYEGPIAGQFNPGNQYWGADLGGPVSEFPDYFKAGGLIGNWKWVYFGDKGLNRILLLQHLTPDELADCIGYLGNSEAGLQSSDGMIVFGFGRERKATPLMSLVPNRFRISFHERSIENPSDHEEFSQVANRTEKSICKSSP